MQEVGDEFLGGENQQLLKLFVVLTNSTLALIE
jgi:hypothetical protein